MHTDVSPPGWEHTTEAMKGNSGIDNPFALAWWMQEQGFHPKDAEDKPVLDAAQELMRQCGIEHGDAVPLATVAPSAGAKPVPEPTLYERETEGDTPWGHNEEIADMDQEHEDDDLLAEHPNIHGHEGHALHGNPALRGGGKGHDHGASAPVATKDEGEEGDEDDDLLNDSEVGPGEHLPQEHAAKAPSDPPAHGPGAKGVKDPEPTGPSEELEAFES